MGFLSGLGIVGAIADVAIEAINANSNENIARIQAENHRKEENTKTIAAAGVLAVGIAGLAYVAGKAIEKNTSTKLSTPIGSIETTNAPRLENKQPSLSVDRNTVWIDRAQGQFGADVIDDNSGEIHKISYKTEKITGKAYNIYVSDGNGWAPAGMIDWSKTRLSDLGKPENGGPIFAEIAQKALCLPR